MTQRPTKWVQLKGKMAADLLLPFLFGYRSSRNFESLASLVGLYLKVTE
jgi:hypothetical protein